MPVPNEPLTFIIEVPVQIIPEAEDTIEGLAQYVHDVALDILSENLEEGDLKYSVRLKEE